MEKDLAQLSVLAEKEDYSVGYFYATKLATSKSLREVSLLKKSEVLSYRLFFADQLSKKEIVDSLIIAITQHTNQGTSYSENPMDIVPFIGVFLKTYIKRGNYKRADSIVKVSKQYRDLVLPFDRIRMDFYELTVKAGLGETASIDALAPLRIKQLHQSLAYDTLSINSTKRVKLLPGESAKRENVLAEYYLLWIEVLKKRGWLEEAQSTLHIAEETFKTLIGIREGYKARLLFLKAQLLFENRELRKSEAMYKNALSVSLQFYLSHASILSDILSQLVVVLQQQNKMEEAAFYINDSKVRVFSYYNRKQIGYMPIHLQEINVEIVNRSYQNAIAHINSCLLTTPTYHKANIDLLQALLTIYQYQGDSSQAFHTLSKLSQQYGALYGYSSFTYQDYLTTEATYRLYALNQFEQALQNYIKVLTTYRSADPFLLSESYITVFTKYTETLFLLEKYNEANTFLDKETRTTPASIQSRMEYRKGYLKTVLLYEVGDLIKATTSLKNNLILADRSPGLNYEDKLHLLYLQLRLALSVADYSLADKLLQDIQVVSETSSLVYTCSVQESVEVARYYYAKGQYQKSDKILRSLLQQSQQTWGMNSFHSMECLNNLVELNTMTGNYTIADRYAEQVLKNAQRIFGEQSYHFSKTAIAVKLYYTDLGDYEKAEYLMNIAVPAYSQWNKEKPTLTQGILYHQSARTLFEADLYTGRKKQYKREDIENRFMESLSILKNEVTEQSVLYSEALIDYALYLAQIQKFDKSIVLLEQSKKTIEATAGSESIHLAQVEFILGKIKLQTKSTEAALAHFIRAKNIYKLHFDESYPGFVSVLGYESRVYYVQKNYTKSIETIQASLNYSMQYIQTIFPYLSERGKANYWSKIKDNFEFYKTLVYTLKETNPILIESMMDLQIKTKSLLLNSLLKIKNKIYAKGDTVAIHLYEKWEASREALALAYSYPESQRKENGFDIVRMEEELESIEKKLSAVSDAFSKSASKKESGNYQWKRLKESLQQGEVAIEIIPFRYFTHTFTDSVIYAFVAVNKNSSSPAVVYNVNGKSLEKKNLKYYRNCLKFETEDKSSYSNYWAPLEPLIGKDITKIYLSTDGVYNQINVEVLKTPADKYLLFHYTIRLIGSTREVIQSVRTTTSTEENTIVLIGNPTYYTTTAENVRAIPQLYGAEKEVETIKQVVSSKQWNTTLLMGLEATEDTLRKLFNPTILHISTHGFFIDASKEGVDVIEGKTSVNPLLTSGLMFCNGGDRMVGMHIGEFNRGDGVLTSYEAMNLNLDQTDLVVLSACETGLGEVKIGEGVFGLQRALSVAGAKCVVMSLSKVSDDVTIQLMQTFYENITKGMERHEAFEKAKIELMQTHPSPKYWGAFIMVGM